MLDKDRDRARKKLLLSGMVLPKWHELEHRPNPRTLQYDLHCKAVPQLRKSALLDLPALEPRITEDLRRLLQWTSDPTRYEVAATDVPIPTRLRTKDIQLQLERGKIGPESDPRGYCRTFTVPEHAKSRFRAIQHPRAHNTLTAEPEKVKFATTQERHAAVLEGEWSIDLDWSGFYDQCGLEREVSKYFSFTHKDPSTGEVSTYSMRVLPMGLKHSVAIANKITEQILNFKTDCYLELYIDNVRVIGKSPEAVVHAAAEIVSRCATAGITVNEVDVKPLDGLTPDVKRKRAIDKVFPLCRQRGDWLGEAFDYENKLVTISDKTRKKVTACMEDGVKTFRAFAGVVGILQYASRTLGLPLAKYFAARRAISAVGWLLESQDQLWDRPMPTLCPDVLKNLRQWQEDILAAPPQHITMAGAPDLVITVDASDWGFGALAVDEFDRVLHVSQQWSDWDKRTFDTGSSVRAEPEGIWRAACRFVRHRHHKRVFFWSDSGAACGAYTKGYSLSYWMNRCILKLNEAFPAVSFLFQHVAGAENPADGLSRGNSTASQAEIDQARSLADKARAARDDG